MQHDRLLHEFTQELCQKEEDFEKLEANMSTLIPAQCLERMCANDTLRDEIEELWHKNKVLSDHLKPLAVEALKLSQEVDVTVKQLNQTMESVTISTEGPTS